MSNHHSPGFDDQLLRHGASRGRFAGSEHPGAPAVRILRLLAGIFRTPARFATAGLILAAGCITVGEVFVVLRLSSWNADFFNLLEKKAVEGLITQIWIFLAIVVTMMCLQGGSLETKMRLQMRLRTWLTRVVRDAWMADGRHYRLRYMSGEHANEEGRLTDDIRVSCEMVVEFGVSLLYSLTQIVLFSSVLWLNSGPLTISAAGASLTIPGHMFWVAILYAIAGAIITILIGHPLVRATDKRQTAEADYRARLVISINHSQTIALSGAESGERRRLGAAFNRILDAWRIQKTSFRNLIYFSAGYGTLTGVLPLLVLAPRYFSGDITLGALMQVTIAFGQVTTALSWLSGNYSGIAQWEASASRVLALHEAVSDIDDEFEGDSAGRFTRAAINGPNLTFRDLSLFSPAGEILVQRFSADLCPGERVLVEATPHAAEGLFRAVAGLSFLGAGRIELPEGSAPLFMGEYPYLPETTLLEALVEQQHLDKLDKDDVARVLVDVGLAKLVPLIERSGKWEQELGIEDRQRLGFAIAILRKPGWILMHEATSALTQAAEDQIVGILEQRLPDAAIIRITHRGVTERGFHRRISISDTAATGIES